MRPVRRTVPRRLRHSGVPLGQDASQRAQAASECLAGVCEEPDSSASFAGRPLPAFEEPTVDADIQLISDGDGLAVIGSPTAVDLFLAAERLASKDLGLPRLGAAFKAGAQVAQVYPEIAEMAGRWVELTKDSAHLVDRKSTRLNSSHAN